MHRPFDFTAPAIIQARIDLAACFRMAAELGMHEGICNHLSAVVPGHPSLFFVNPLGLSFSEITASRLLICDFEGNVLDGLGEPERTAFHIHARIHVLHPSAKACFHTHMPYATALCSIEGAPLSWTSQASLKFFGRIAVDDEYNGLALDPGEGDRIASIMGHASIAFLRNHGVIVVGASIGEAWDDLYYLERACQNEYMARCTQGRLSRVAEETAARTSKQWSSFGPVAGRLHLASIKRHLDRLAVDYAA